MLVFAGALVLTMGVTPVARWLAPRMGVMDRPEVRKIHRRPVPRMGGVAIYLAVIVAALVLGERYNFAQFGSILVGATGVSFMGLIDDRWGLRPLVKMLGQTLAALLLYISGVYVGTFGHPILNLVTTVLWVGYITNAVNFLDNMDGLAGGVSAVAAAFFALMCSFSGQYLVGALSIAVLGACLGFLFYNLNPASIFMGDSGALFLGFILAAIGIKLRFPDNVTFVTWMVPVLVMGLPVFDTMLVIVSRLRRRLNPATTPGKDHVSHRLVLLGLSQKRAVIVLYAVCCALGLAGLLIMYSGLIQAYAIGAAVLLVGLASLVALERVTPTGGTGGSRA